MRKISALRKNYSCKHLYFKKRSQINNLSFHYKTLEKEEQRIKKEIIKINMEINETKNRTTIMNINETKSLVLERMTNLTLDQPRNEERRLK